MIQHSLAPLLLERASRRPLTLARPLLPTSPVILPPLSRLEHSLEQFSATCVSVNYMFPESSLTDLSSDGTSGTKMGSAGQRNSVLAWGHYHDCRQSSTVLHL